MRRPDARGGRRRARAARLRDHHRLGRLLRRQGRHHPPRGRRPPARAAAGRTSRAGFGVETVPLLRGPRHRHRRRRRHRARGAVRAPAARGRRAAPARRDRLDQGQHRPHQGRRRRRRADQGDAGGAPPGASRPPPATYDPHPVLLGDDADPARAAHGRAVAGRRADPGRVSPRWASAASTPTSSSRHARPRTPRRGSTTRTTPRSPRPRRTPSCCCVDGADPAELRAGVAEPGSSCVPKLSFAELATWPARCTRELSGRPLPRRGGRHLAGAGASARLGRAAGRAGRR